VNTALLVIDVQTGLFDGEIQPFEADAVIQRINRLAEMARAVDVPVVFIQHEAPGSPLAFESPAWQLAKGLEFMTNDRRIRKTTPDSFHSTDLGALLESLGVDHLVITGYASEFCVDTTTRRAAALGYRITLVTDAHTTKDKAHASAASIRAHENATLPDLTSFGTVIRPVLAADVRFDA